MNDWDGPDRELGKVPPGLPDAPDPASIELHVLAFLIERRLTENEAVAVIKVLKGDVSIRWLADHWGSPWEGIPAMSKRMVEDLVRRKVLAWMDKYHEGHRARCMFTGES